MGVELFKTRLGDIKKTVNMNKTVNLRTQIVSEIFLMESSTMMDKSNLI